MRGRAADDGRSAAAQCSALASSSPPDRIESPHIVHTQKLATKPASAYLMAFDTDKVTVYQIRSQHRHEEVQEVISPDYSGVMETQHQGLNR